MISDTSEDVYNVYGAVVVGVDGSDSSLRALEWAAEQARLTDRRLVAVTTWEWPTTFGANVGWPSDVDFEKDAAQILHDSITQAFGTEGTERLTQLVIHGHPAPVLVEASKNAALVVVGSRGHGGFTGLLLGSVSEFLATHAECPVVIIRQGSSGG